MKPLKTFIALVAVLTVSACGYSQGKLEDQPTKPPIVLGEKARAVRIVNCTGLTSNLRIYRKLVSDFNWERLPVSLPSNRDGVSCPNGNSYFVDVELPLSGASYLVSVVNLTNYRSCDNDFAPNSNICSIYKGTFSADPQAPLFTRPVYVP